MKNVSFFHSGIYKNRPLSIIQMKHQHPSSIKKVDFAKIKSLDPYLLGLLIGYYIVPSVIGMVNIFKIIKFFAIY